MALSSEQRKRIKADWPAFYYLLDQPGMERFFEQAITKGWGPGEFQSNLMATPWWKSHSKVSRNWDTLVATDPREAVRQRNMRRQEVEDEARRLGVNYKPWDIIGIAEQSLRGGLSSQGITHLVAALGDRRGIAQAGDIRASMQSLRALGKSFAVNISNPTLMNWAQAIATGRLTEDGLRSYVVNLAKQRIDPQNQNKVLRAALDQGLTVRDAYAGVLQSVSHELEIDESRIDLTNPYWGKLLDFEDTKGVQRPMNNTEAVQWARGQDAWQATNSSKEAYSGLANAMTTKWGLKK